jgi:multisubunit Na+/H+ antiporter MnhB subunit
MKTKRVDDFEKRRALRLSCGLLLAVVWITMTAALLELPSRWRGLLPEVKAQMAKSGVDHPVTAVLLNFRGYDTLLEIVVLFMAALGVWSLGFVKPGRAESPAGPVLSALVRVLLPVLILVSAYLLDRGATGPGGAFQAGAVLGTAGVLFLLSDIPFSSAWFSWPLKTALIAGPGVFLGVAAFTVLMGYPLLQYPTPWAKHLIVLVESVATLSIAATLLVLFAGGRPRLTPPPMAEPGACDGEEA